MLDQRSSRAQTRPAGQTKDSRQRRLDHSPRISHTLKNPHRSTRPPVGARFHAPKQVETVTEPIESVTPAETIGHALTGRITKKRRYALLATAAAAVAVGTAGLSAASPDHGAGLPFVQASVSGAMSTIDGASANAQVLHVAPPPPTAFTDWVLEKGARFDKIRAEEAAKALRPLFTPFTTGVFTSGYGMRWGAMHGGVDIANGVGTAINAVADGEIIKSGDYNDGYGNSVRIRHTDGTETLYGHMTSTSVTVGQKVLAGDLIGLMGSTGYSTGSHCHFEVWLNGTERIDPVGWLASRGISVGAID